MGSGTVMLIVAVLAGALAVVLARVRRPEPGSAVYERNDPLRALHEATDEALRGLGHEPAWTVTAPGTRTACCERCSGVVTLACRGDGSGAQAQAHPPAGSQSRLYECPGAVTVLAGRPR
jgi:hypothetical protein